ncbi:MAG: hypothetical protein R2711_14785 [Acidimicrobiales bacterium]
MRARRRRDRSRPPPRRGPRAGLHDHRRRPLGRRGRHPRRRPRPAPRRARHPPGAGFEGTSTLRVCNLLAHGPLWQQVPVHERVLPVVEGVLDAGCLVSSLSSITILPASRPSRSTPTTS